MDEKHPRHTLPVQQEKAQLQKRDRQRTLLFRWATTASVIFILALCIYFWLHRPPRSKNDLRPATLGATLTGRYQFTTAKGQYYSLVLPDSTRVWLNANSSLTYPPNFTDSQRQVELTGEAYFEVHPDPKSPFIVLLPDEARVQTHEAKFDIYAYTDDAGFLTSLMAGSAEMDAGRIDKVPLKPGQAASYWRLKGLQLDSAADQQAVLDWKNNLFVLDHKPIYQLLKDITNWYDAVIIDDKDAKYDTTHLSGIVPRTAPVSTLLEAIESQSRLRFAIDGKTITIIKGDSTPQK